MKLSNFIFLCIQALFLGIKVSVLHLTYTNKQSCCILIQVHIFEHCHGRQGRDNGKTEKQQSSVGEDMVNWGRSQHRFFRVFIKLISFCHFSYDDQTPAMELVIIVISASYYAWSKIALAILLRSSMPEAVHEDKSFIYPHPKEKQ